MTAHASPADRAAAEAARSLAAHLLVLADGMAAAASALPTGTPGWEGTAARVAAASLATRPAGFERLAAGCRRAAEVLAAHARVLAEAEYRNRAADNHVERATVEARLPDEMQAFIPVET